MPWLDVLFQRGDCLAVSGLSNVDWSHIAGFESPSEDAGGRAQILCGGDARAADLARFWLKAAGRP